MDERAQAGERRRQTRVGVQATVDIRFEDFHSFLSTQTTNLSRGGMFVATDYPPPRGTLISFEMRLEDGYSLVRGRGEVVWSRPRGVVADEPAGMGVRFAELDEDGRRLVERIVSDLEAGGRTPFDLERLSGGAAANQSPVSDSEADGNVRSSDGSVRRSVVSSHSEGKTSLDDTAAALRRARAAAGSRPRRRGPLLVMIAALAVAVLATAMWFGSRLLRSPQESTSATTADIESAEDGGAGRERDPVDAGRTHEAGGLLDTQVDVKRPLVDPPAMPGDAGGGTRPASAQSQDATPTKGERPAATAVDAIEWKRVNGAGLSVTIACNGPLEPSRVRFDALSRPPRLLLRLRGITERFRPFVLDVSEPELTTIRIGEHPELSPAELHVVLDLAGSRAGSPEVNGNTVRIVLEAE